MAQEMNHQVKKRLYDDVCNITDEARRRVAVYENSEASMMNWNVGKPIKANVPKNNEQTMVSK